MALVIRWNPAANFFAPDEINHMLEWTSDAMHELRKTEQGSAWVPTADMYETAEAFVIQLELAGIERDSLEIYFQDGRVFLRGNRPLSPRMQAAKIHRRECLYGHFQRVFQIPQPIDAQHISASYDQGVLKIVLSKVNRASSDHVKIHITI